nr:hypothetical protein [Tanacetum cinerariifolium]
MSIQDMELQKEQYLEEMQKKVANLSTYTFEPSRRFNFICYDDDDDEERTIPLSEIIFQLPSSIVITTFPLVLPIEDPEDSLIIGNEELSTIPEKESDEVIESSVEELVPILSESEDTSGSDSDDINPLFDEVLEGIESKASYDSNLDSNEDECFDLGGNVDEINAFDIPLDCEDGYYDSEGDILY